MLLRWHLRRDPGCNRRFGKRTDCDDAGRLSGHGPFRRRPVNQTRTRPTQTPRLNEPRPAARLMPLTRVQLHAALERPAG